MSYNRKNILQRMIDIQNIVLMHTERGATQEWVYENEIYPVYRISRRTFYSYITANAKDERKNPARYKERRREQIEKLKAELKKIETVENLQASLF